MADLKDYTMEQVLEWLKTIKITDQSLKAIEELKMIGEELVDAEADELMDDGVTGDDAKRIIHAIKSFKPLEDTAEKPTDTAGAAVKKEAPEIKILKAQLAEAEKSYKELVNLKKAMSAITMPVGCILQCKEELNSLPEEKKGPTQKKFTMYVKKRDEVLKKLRELRSTFKEDSENWRAIAEIHEGSMQVVSKNSNYNFGKLVTTHTSRVFREQRAALASIKDAKQKLKKLGAV
uniref:SAM domain-containing protein n=1 Tax=Lotharella oceanica TaxID=641309 RepID=A0A7S2U0A4_9EUKA|eukprot:CAMPEP_0170167084 /NCGR_PEP_ID=MMETSP0040_2-20121228/585_1 /TAXON_ID=641309 /ORGANISM="Lotharella oceanica, Strain CCMP622" /LENGTH=233 /DNA_ID=CAMNT_0010404995 /DNA_START=32 /DNA_END=733 /DNA_ORIENTATION=+